MQSNIWIITLNEESDRCRETKNCLDTFSIPYRIFKGVRGSSLSREEREENTTPVCRDFLCTPGIIGCGMSHIGLWRQLLEDESTDFYVVLEDDAKLIEPEVFRELYQKIAEKKMKFDYISMHCAGVCLKVGDQDVVEKPGGLTTLSYIVSKEGARKLLGFTEGKVAYHIDFVILLANFNHPSFKKLATNKDLFTTIGDTSSAISSQNKTLVYALSNNDNLNWFCNVPFFVLNRRVVSQEFFWTFLLTLIFVGLLLRYKKDYLAFALFFLIVNFIFCLVYYLESKPVWSDK